MQLIENKRSSSFLIAEISAIRKLASHFQTSQRAQITTAWPASSSYLGLGCLATSHSPLATAFERATRKLEFKITRLKSATSKFLIDKFCRDLRITSCGFLILSTLTFFAAFPTSAQTRSLRGSHTSVATRAAVQAAASAPKTKMLGFTAASAAKEQTVEKEFLPLASTQEIRTFHRYLTAEPHPAGSVRNNDLAKWVAQKWREQGLEDVQIHEYDVLNSTPKSALVELVAPTHFRASLREDAYPQDQ